MASTVAQLRVVTHEPAARSSSAGVSFDAPTPPGKYAWGSGPRILLVHGWAGRATQLGAFIEPLVAAGYCVVGFDLPAHGRSDGQRTSLLDFRDALLEIGKLHGLFAGVIGHSMGAAAATLACASGLQTARLALVASPASLLDQTKLFASTLGVSPALYRRITKRLENRTRTELASVDVERSSRRGRCRRGARPVRCPPPRHAGPRPPQDLARRGGHRNRHGIHDRLACARELFDREARARRRA